MPWDKISGNYREVAMNEGSTVLFKLKNVILVDAY